MGAPVTGRLLTLEELARLDNVIREKYIHSLQAHFGERYSSGNQPLRIVSAGREIEATLLTPQRELAPVFEQLETLLGTEMVTPENLRSQAEVKDGIGQLFSLDTPLGVLQETTRNMLDGLSAGARQVGAEVFLMGGYPTIIEERASEVLTTKMRYIALKQRGSPLSQPVDLVFADGSRKTLKGNTLNTLRTVFTSMQTTLKIPTRYAGAVHDAAYLLGPVLLAASTASPFVEGRPTIYDSARAIMLPSANYGFPNTDYLQGRLGRWGSREPLTTATPERENKWFSREAYDALRQLGVSPSLAIYFGRLAGDGFMLLTEEDIQNSLPHFPSPTSWPDVKFQYGLLDSEGIGIELRLGEMPAPDEIVSFSLTHAAMLLGVAKEVYEGRVHPLSCAAVNRNIRTAALAAPPSAKTFRWSERSIAFPELMMYLGNVAAGVLEEHAYSPSERQEILNPVLGKAGIFYTGTSFREIAPEPTLAERMRQTAYRWQPDLLEGKVLHQDTLQAMMEHCRYRPEQRTGMSMNQELRA